MRDTKNALFIACDAILRKGGVPRFGDGPYHWLVSSELIEEYLPSSTELRIYGYRVHMEVMLGEHTVVLMQTVGVADVRDAVGV